MLSDSEVKIERGRLLGLGAKYPVIFGEYPLRDPYYLAFLFVFIPAVVLGAPLYEYMRGNLELEFAVVLGVLLAVSFPTVVVGLSVRSVVWRWRIGGLVRRVRGFRSGEVLVAVRCMLPYRRVLERTRFKQKWSLLPTRLEEPVVLVDVGDGIEVWGLRSRKEPMGVIAVDAYFYMLHVPGVGSNHVYQGLAIGTRGFVSARAGEVVEYAVVVRPFVEPVGKRGDYARQVEDSVRALERLDVVGKELRAGSVIVRPAGGVVVSLAVTFSVGWYLSVGECSSARLTQGRCEPYWITPDMCWSQIGAWYPDGLGEQCCGVARVGVVDTADLPAGGGLTHRGRACPHGHPCKSQQVEFSYFWSGWQQVFADTVSECVVVRQFIPLRDVEGMTVPAGDKTLGFVLEYECYRAENVREFLRSTEALFPRLTNTSIPLPAPTHTTPTHTTHTGP